MKLKKITTVLRHVYSIKLQPRFKRRSSENNIRKVRQMLGKNPKCSVKCLQRVEICQFSHNYRLYTISYNNNIEKGRLILGKNPNVTYEMLAKGCKNLTFYFLYRLKFYEIKSVFSKNIYQNLSQNF